MNRDALAAAVDGEAVAVTAHTQLLPAGPSRLRTRLPSMLSSVRRGSAVARVSVAPSVTSCQLLHGLVKGKGARFQLGQHLFAVDRRGGFFLAGFVTQGG